VILINAISGGFSNSIPENPPSIVGLSEAKSYLSKFSDKSNVLVWAKNTVTVSANLYEDTLNYREILKDGILQYQSKGSLLRTGSWSADVRIFEYNANKSFEDNVIFSGVKNQRASVISEAYNAMKREDCFAISQNLVKGLNSYVYIFINRSKTLDWRSICLKRLRAFMNGLPVMKLYSNIDIKNLRVASYLDLPSSDAGDLIVWAAHRCSSEENSPSIKNSNNRGYGWPINVKCVIKKLNDIKMWELNYGH